MGHDPFSPVSLAAINVLCLPVRRVEPTTFASWIQLLSEKARCISRVSRSVEDTRQEDSSEHVKDGALLFQFSGNSENETLTHTSHFEPNRQPCLFLGLLDVASLSKHELETLHDVCLTTLDELRSATSGYANEGAVFRLAIIGNVAASLPSDALILGEFDQIPDSVLRQIVEAASASLYHSLERIRLHNVDLPQLKNAPEAATLSEVRQEPRAEDGRRQSILPSLTRSPTQTPPVPDVDTQNSQSGKTVSMALIKLQLGLWQEALQQFADGARASREVNSPAWHARALDGILTCLLLLAWSGQSFDIPQDCYPTYRGLSSNTAINNIAEANRTVSEKYAGASAHRLQALTAFLPGLLATIVNLYDRATLGFDNALPTLLVCESRIRLCNLLITTRKHEGMLSTQALSDILSQPMDKATNGNLEPPSTSLVLRPSHLSSLLVEAIVEAQASLHIESAAGIYLAACQALSDIELVRKQGFFLKDVLQKLPPVLVEARRRGAAHHSRSSAQMSHSLTSSKPQLRVSQAVRALLQLAARIFGLPDLLYTPQSQSREEDLQSICARLSSWLAVFTSGDIATKLEILRLCVRISDALPDLRGSVDFMSLVLFISRQTMTFTRAIVNAVPLIPAEEQARLSSGISSTIEYAHKVGVKEEIAANYWDDFLVRGIEVYEHPSAGRLVPHSSQDLSHTTKSGTAKRDPFIYNPFSDTATVSGPRILVRDDVATFDVFLQNTLEIDIEIERLTLLAEGGDFESHRIGAVIGPLSLQTFRVSGVPRTTGTMRIIGCKVKVKHCFERDFPVFRGTWKRPQAVEQKQTPEIHLPTSTPLELNVIKPLPQLRISSTSLSQNSLMVLDGEKTKLTLTMHNSSHITADFVLFGFHDSVAKQLQEILDSKDPSPADAYEIQHQLTSRPAIRRIHHDAHHGTTIAINAGQAQIFEFEVQGKPGLTEVVIVVDYTHLGKPRNEIEGTFHTRQIQFHIGVTVNGTIDIPRCSILSMPGNCQLARALNDEAQAEDHRDQRGDAQTNQCLLQLDLRSFWQTPIEVTIQLPKTGSERDIAESVFENTDTYILQPGQIERALIAIPRIFVAEPFAPIPSLDTKRQFVVSASKLSLEADLAAREAFWYREELCKRLSIKWHEVHGIRKGDVDVRKGVRLSARIIDALRVEHVQISFEVNAASDFEAETVLKHAESNYEVKRHTSLNLVVRIHNLTQNALRFMLRLQPSLQDQPHNMATDLGKKFVWSGTLQRAIKRPLEPGAFVEMNTSIILLAEGVYEVNATIEELSSRRDRSAELTSTELFGDRRIWHARKPCMLTVSPS